jgi:hypothetical protein
MMAQMVQFWTNISDPIAGELYAYNLTGRFNVTKACAASQCVLVRPQTGLEHFQSVITLFTSTFGLTGLIAAIAVRQLSKMAARMAWGGGKGGGGRPKERRASQLDRAVTELQAVSTSSTAALRGGED